jgi:hypothetical protein
VAGGQQALAQMGPDESGRAGDDDSQVDSTLS